MAGSSPGPSSRIDFTREAQHDDGGYDSTNEDDYETLKAKRARMDLAEKPRTDNSKSRSGKAKADLSVFTSEQSKEEFRRTVGKMNSLNAYDRHKQLVNTYQLYYPGATGLNQRDVRNDKRDIDIIKDHHRFLWKESDEENTWEVQLAKRYYDKLFKEYVIIDLSRYKENKFGMRWRQEKEVVTGKGQFVCGNKKCSERKKLKTWEVNFGYIEHNEKKNALVKCRLCFECSYMLNYHHKKKQLKKKKKKKGKKKKRSRSSSTSSRDSSSGSEDQRSKQREEEKRLKEEETLKKQEAEWTKPLEKDEKTTEEVIDEYLDELFL